MITWLGVAAEKPSAEKPSVTRIEEVIDYFKCTWLNGQFRLTVWKMFMEDGPRTNNNLDRWHNKVKEITGKKSTQHY